MVSYTRNMVWFEIDKISFDSYCKLLKFIYQESKIDTKYIFRGDYEEDETFWYLRGCVCGEAWDAIHKFLDETGIGYKNGA